MPRFIPLLVADGERLTLYLKPDGRFLFYSHSSGKNFFSENAGKRFF